MYLIATSLGMYQHGTAFDSFIGKLLQEDGQDFRILLCDGQLPACQMSKLSRTTSKELAIQGQNTLCKKCTRRGQKSISDFDKDLSKNIFYYSDFLSSEDLSDIHEKCSKLNSLELQKLKYDRAPVGEHGYASALRFFARGDLEGEEYGEEILRKYVEGACVSYKAFSNIFKTGHYHSTIVHHGIYTPQGLCVYAAKQHGVDVVTWIKSYREQTFLFSHNDTYHHTMLEEPETEWSEFELNRNARKRVQEYIASRRDGERDWISFNKSPIKPATKEFDDIECLLLTSVLWDAQVHYKANLFEGILDWTLKTIEFWIKENKKGTLCIRVHPAEVTGYIQSRQKVSEEIHAKFPNLPDNIRIIPAEDTTSTYDLIERCQYVSAYSTKTAIEAAMMGKPVVVCGDAWVRNKGISIDPKSEEHYFRILSNPSQNLQLQKSQQLNALKYAYHFFMRRMLDIDCFSQDRKGQLVFEVKKFAKQSEKLQNSLDVIRNGLYSKSPFSMKAELLEKPALVNPKLKFLSDISVSSVLSSTEEIEIAGDVLDGLGLARHHDETKNWDLAKFVTCLNSFDKKVDRILDAGCGVAAHVAVASSKLGFENVYACDIKRNDFLKRTKVLEFSLQDVCKTNYEDSYFSFISSLSVIEHLFSPKDHIAEMARVLRPGGELLITTDYWPIKLYTGDIFPYGGDQPPMCVFSSDEVQELVEFAGRQGLSLVGELNLAAQNKVCTWERVGKQYTFLFLRFRKRS